MREKERQITHEELCAKGVHHWKKGAVISSDPSVKDVPFKYCVVCNLMEPELPKKS